MDVRRATLEMTSAGLSCLGTRLRDKRPAVPSWADLQSRIPQPDEADGWVAMGADSIGLICGKISGGVEALDFDNHGECWPAFCELVEDLAPGLIQRLAVQETQSGGRHAVYRCEAVEGNRKLAQRPIEVDGRPGKQALIETRGEGGYILAAPSDGYRLLAGSWADIPMITAEERAILFRAARSLDEMPTTQEASKPAVDGSSPGDRYNRGPHARDWTLRLLEREGWTVVSEAGDCARLRRPGKDRGWSGTLHRSGAFTCFSSNAHPFEGDRDGGLPGKPYSPFAVFALLEYNGDFRAAAAALHKAEEQAQERRQRNGQAVADLVEERPDIERAMELLREAEKEKPSPVILRTHADRLRDRLRPPPAIIADVVAAGGVLAIIAMPKQGKSLLSVEAARCIASGEPFGEKAVSQGRVIYACPDSPASTERRMLAIPAPIADQIHTVCHLPIPGGIDSLCKAVEQEHQKTAVRAVVIDTWDSTRDHSSGDWASQDAIVEKMMRSLRDTAERIGCAIIVVHHATRGDGGRARGSSVFDAKVEAVGLVEKDGECISLRTTIARDYEEGPVGRWRICAHELEQGPAVPVLFRMEAQNKPGPDTDAQRERQVLATLITMARNCRDITGRSLAQQACVPETSARRAIEGLRKRGLVQPRTLAPTIRALEMQEDEW